MKTLEQLRAERLSTQTPVQTPVQEAPKPTNKVLSAAADTGIKVANTVSNVYNKLPRPLRSGLGWVMDTLSAPEYALAGGLKSAYSEAEKQKSENRYSVGGRLQAFAKGVPSGIKEKTTLFDVNPAEKLGIKNKGLQTAYNLATSLAIPSTPVGKISKVTGLERNAPKILKAATEIGEKIPVVNKGVQLAKDLSYTGSAPEKFLRKYEEYQRNISRATERAGEIAKPLKYGPDGKELPKETQRILGDILGLAEGTNRAVTPEELKLISGNENLVKSTLAKFQKLAEEDIRAGADPKIYERFLGKYSGKKIYRTVEESKKAATSSPFAKSKQPRLDLSLYKKRLDLPEEVQKELGRVKEPAYGAAVAAYGTGKNIETRNLFKWVAKNYVDKGEDLVTLPKTEKLGILSERKVPRQIANYLDEVINPIPDTTTSKLIRFFKEGKTILSPKQLIRNIPASQIQAYLNPSGSAISFRRIPEALNEVKTKGKYYREAKNLGLVGQTFATTELARFIPEELSSYKDQKSVYEKLRRAGGNTQNFNEEMVKMQVFIEERKLGKSAMEAAKAAEETAFNYQKVSPLVKKLRSGKAHLGPLPFSVPFITYPMKAAELTAKTAYYKPSRLTNIPKVERAIQSLSPEGNEQFLPDYLREAFRTPFTSPQTGNRIYANAKYLYPFGNLTEGGTPLGITPDPILMEVVSQIADRDAFQMLQKVFAGEDPMDVKRISDQDLLSIPMSGRLRHVMETFGPTVVRSAFKYLESQTKRGISSTQASPQEAILQELGAPIYQYSPATGAQIQSFERTQKIRDAKADLSKYIRERKPGTLMYKYGLEQKQKAVMDAIRGQ